jgi:predicted RNA-binding protein with RPS1 domain
MPDKVLTMDELLAQHDAQPLQAGDVLEGVVTSIKKHEVWIDLGARGTGVVLRREIGHGQKLEEGENVTVSVIDPEMEEGHSLLSMRRAAKDRGWEELERQFQAGETVVVQAYDANRGGLLIEMEGIRGFLPVSQLAAGHYPRVSGADKDEILQKLNALTNKDLRVRILDVSRKDNKLIFSEKEAVKEDMASRFATLNVGDVVEGVVTGVIEQMRGSVAYGPLNEAEKYNQRFRRSIFVIADIKQGETFSEKNIQVIRPALGLPSRHWHSILGKTASTDLRRGTPLLANHVEHFEATDPTIAV